MWLKCVHLCVCLKVCQWRFPGRSCYKSSFAVTTPILCHWRERACPLFHFQCPNLCKSTALMLKAISSAINLTVTTSAQSPDNVAPRCGSRHNSPQFVIPTNLSLLCLSRLPPFLEQLLRNTVWCHIRVQKSVATFSAFYCLWNLLFRYKSTCIYLCF